MFEKYKCIFRILPVHFWREMVSLTELSHSNSFLLQNMEERNKKRYIRYKVSREMPSDAAAATKVIKQKIAPHGPSAQFLTRLLCWLGI